MGTLYELIRAHAEDPNARERPALLAPGRPPSSYAALLEQCDYVARCLAACGVANGDRVALVLPNGPEMAACFLSVASFAGCAPLNPAYKEAELEFYFEDLAPKVLIVDPALPSPAAELARARGIAVCELRTRSEQHAGRFELSPVALSDRALLPSPPDAIALVLHTSGTTSRPKMVPLSQSNLFVSAGHIGATLQLTPDDRCLNIMPLFHIHGLIGVLASSVRAGAGVLCTPGFDAARFPDWLGQECPTWISAVPTMYEAIANHAGSRCDAIARGRLRLLRSSSSSLAPSLMASLENTFDVPVIESYGMTEATHQMASNPLPPGVRKPGSVGRAAGPEIAIVHPDRFELLPQGETGEIAIRGPNVTRGYIANPAANAASFQEGWFRTGDLGHIDADGYLFISGRLKEQINRGGEKIAPREVDEAILLLCDVRQAVTFAVPHKTLGEDLAAAVVLRAGASLDADAIRAHLAERLAPFKMPARILFLDEIPKGPTGKIQRIGLAKQLASWLEEEYVAPKSAIEQQLVEIWADVLKLDVVGTRSNFFALGGDSLRALTISARAAERRLMLPVDVLFREPTIERLAPHVKAIEDFSDPSDSQPGALTLYGFQRVILFPGAAMPEHFSSPSEVVFELDEPIDRAALERAVLALCRHHDAFRFSFAQGKTTWTQRLLAEEEIGPEVVAASIHECAPEELVSRVSAMHRRFDLARPPLFRFVFTRGAPSSLVIVAHHLAADAMSLRIVAEDLALAYQSARLQEPIELPHVPTPAVVFMRRYERAARKGRFRPDQAAWMRVLGDEEDDDAVPDWTKSAVVGAMRHLGLDLGSMSPHILRYASAHNVPPRDILLAASIDAAAAAFGVDELRVLLMSSGREQPLFGDLSRTVGCFVNLLPLRLRPPRGASFEAARQWMSDQIMNLPSGGFSIPAMYLTEPSDVWLRIAMWQVASQMFINYKGVLGPRAALGPTSAGMRGQPCTYDIAKTMTHLQTEAGELPRSFALQLHFEQVGDAFFGDLYCATDLHGPHLLGTLAECLVERLGRIL
jgi:acyl-CoA synthetase (AMP-forming)/AMP-acid ligase II